MKENFDLKIKEMLDGYELPFEASAWQQLSDRLDAAQPNHKPEAPSNPWLNFGIAAAGVVALFGVLWLTVPNNQEGQNSEMRLIPDPVAASTKVETAPGVTQNSAPQVLTEQHSLVKSSTDGPAQKNHTDAPALKVDERAAQPTEQAKPALPVQNQPQASRPQPQFNDSAPVGRGDVDEEVQPYFEPSATKLCVGETLGLINQSVVSGRATQFHWEFGDGQSSDARSPGHVYNQPGKYTVSLQGGKSKKTHQVEIEVLPAPEAEPVAELVFTGSVIPLYNLSVNLGSGEKAEWVFADGGVARTASVQRLFRQAGQGTYTLTVSNAVGCKSISKGKGLDRGSFNLLSPDAFTPNNDGLNDEFLPRALEVMGLPFTLTITDPRSNQVVFSTTSSDRPWNGRVNNSGDLLTKGSYLWSVVLGADVAKNRTFTGTILLQ